MNKLKKIQVAWNLRNPSPADWGIDESLTDRAAKILQEEIDWEIESDLLVAFGWHKINIESTVYTSAQIGTWLTENATGAYHGRSRTWLFENKKDAILFALRWA